MVHAEIPAVRHFHRLEEGRRVARNIRRMRVAVDADFRAHFAAEAEERFMRIEPVFADAEQVDLQRHLAVDGTADQTSVVLIEDLFIAVVVHQIGMRKIGEQSRAHRFAGLVHVRFQIGFVLYLAFVAIDLIISNILLAMGMMMVSPTTISLPFKLLLFVTLDGWLKISQGLMLSYQ